MTTELPSAQQAPWLAAQLQQLQRAHASARLPAALLIHDERGAGGEALALFAAQLALCREMNAPCGQCRDCRQVQSGQHPDFLLVRPTEESKFIRIEQVRDLAQELTLTAHSGGATVALLAPADSMNSNAANALLKTLEEPRRGVMVILLCTVPSRLPATVLSRCQRLQVARPTRALSVAWLEQHKGPAAWAAVLDVLGDAPYEALRVDAGEVVRLKAETEHALNEVLSGRLEIAACAERWGRAEGFELRLACIENWLTARIDGAAVATGQTREMRSSTHLSQTSSDMNIAVLLRLLDGVYELRRLRLSSINRSLALEQLLWQLARAMRPAAAPASV